MRYHSTRVPTNPIDPLQPLTSLRSAAGVGGVALPAADLARARGVAGATVSQAEHRGAGISLRAADAQDAPKPRDPNEAQPERPTVSTHAGTVATGYFEIETGIEFDQRADRGHNTLATLNAKFGIGARQQFFLVGSNLKASGVAGGLGDLTAGLKWRVAEDNEWLGDFAIQPSVKFATGSVAKGTGTGTTDASLLFVSSRDIGPVHLDLNAGYTLRTGGGAAAPPNSTIWTASFSGMFGEKAGWCAELFGFPGTGGANGSPTTVGFLAGPTFAVRKNVVLDLGGIVPVSGPQPRAAYLGVTWNLGKL